MLVYQMVLGLLHHAPSILPTSSFAPFQTSSLLHCYIIQNPQKIHTLSWGRYAGNERLKLRSSCSMHSRMAETVAPVEVEVLHRESFPCEVICRKAAALLALGKTEEAVSELQQACRTTNFTESGAWQGVSQAAKGIPIEWQAKYWADLISRADTNNPFSSRDGRLLRRVPRQSQLSQDETAAYLSKALHSQLKDDATSLLLHAWAEGRSPGRASVALLRSSAYLKAGKWEQALKDAKAAAAYGPHANGSSCWPRALAATSSAIEGKQVDNTLAALFMQKAVELEPASTEYATDLERLMRRIPDQHADALQAGGSKALQAVLAQEMEDALPEFRRARPKYFYYYKWMRERVRQHCDKLPAPVLEKVIRIDATELDMLLTYPKGIQRQAAKLLGVYCSGGLEALAATRLPLLSWKEAEELKAEHTSLALEALKGPVVASLQGVSSAAEEEEDLDALEPVHFD